MAYVPGYTAEIEADAAILADMGGCREYFGYPVFSKDATHWDRVEKAARRVAAHRQAEKTAERFPLSEGRPFRVWIDSKFFKGNFDFATRDEASAYLRKQIENTHRVEAGRFDDEFHANTSFVQEPGATVTLALDWDNAANGDVHSMRHIAAFAGSADEAQRVQDIADRDEEALAAASDYLATLRPDQVAAIGRDNSHECLANHGEALRRAPFSQVGYGLIRATEALHAACKVACSPVFATEWDGAGVVTFDNELAASLEVAALNKNPAMPSDHYADIESDRDALLRVVVRYRGGLNGACRGWPVGYLARKPVA